MGWMFGWLLDLLGAAEEEEHKHHFDFTLGERIILPTEGGGFVGFQLIPCVEGCGRATIMPVDKLGLCTDAAKEKFFQDLEEKGLVLELGCSS